MKVVFVGPSLPALSAKRHDHPFPSLTVRPPARRGDVLKATLEGASAIGIIDGYFEQMPAVWHKEILHALSLGVAVYGAASMGALRAAECAAFGMVCIGDIALDYAEGRRLDDADVAQLHGPAELGYPALSEPIVTVEAVLQAALENGMIDPSLQASLLDAARRLFFKRRTWTTIFETAGFSPGGETEEAVRGLASHVNPKRADALKLLEKLESLPEGRLSPPSTDWTLSETSQWQALLKGCVI